MYYTPLKQKETITHIARTVYKAVDKILMENDRITDLNFKYLFTHIDFLRICAYKVSTDIDLLSDTLISGISTEKDPVFDQTITEFLVSNNQLMISVFDDNLQDLMDLTKEFPEFSELNKYIYEVLYSDRN